MHVDKFNIYQFVAESIRTAVNCRLGGPSNEWMYV